MRLPFVLARRFVAAETFADTVPVLETLHQSGLHTTLDLLGEYISDWRKAEDAAQIYAGLAGHLGAFSHAHAARNMSIKLSMLGQKIDEHRCETLLRGVLDHAKANHVFVRLDMEGSDITASTVRLFERVYKDYPESVGIVLQAYLHRTADDISHMVALGARVRLCKGAYKEPARLALQDMPSIRKAYLSYAEQLLDGPGYPALATHDDTLFDGLRELVSNRDRSSFEFQMLYGIRPDTQKAFVNEGYQMRIYVPYGEQWFPYFSRRLRERKENVWFVLSNLFRT